MWELHYISFSSIFSFCKMKNVAINENISFTDYASGIRLPDWPRLGINWRNDNDFTTCWHDVLLKFFWRCFYSLFKFSYWSKFNVNIITFSGVVTLFFYKGLIRNLEIRNTPFWLLLIIWRLGRVRDTKFGTNFSNEMLLNPAKWSSFKWRVTVSGELMFWRVTVTVTLQIH